MGYNPLYMISDENILAQDKHESFYVRSKLKKILSNSLILCYGLHFLFNMLGSSTAVATYGIIAVMTVIIVVLADLEDSILVIIPFLFIEGQGRVVMGYNPVARILFDGLLALAMLKVIIKNRKLISRKVIPKPLTALIMAHFVWFFLLLFLSKGPGILLSLSTSKL